MMTSGKWIAVAAGVLVGVTGLSAGLLASCAQTPVNVPVQTFEQPKNMDVVCLQVFDGTPAGNPLIPAVPQREAACAQVPVNVYGGSLPFHLFALVTQETRGELAVVDLTAGNVVDVDPNTPGINFLPVGPLPSDVAVTPDGRMAFVGSAAPSSPAIFGLPTTLILGDSQAADGGIAPGKVGAVVPQLTSWPVCALPQAPGAIRVLPNSVLPSAATGAPPAGWADGYSIVAVLPGDSVHSAKVVTIDPVPFLRGAGFGADAGIPDGNAITPGTLPPCPYLDVRPLDLARPPSGPVPPPGPAWDDGVKYVDGGVDAEVPTTAVACVPRDAGGPGSSFVTPATPIAGATVLDTSGPRPILYIADSALPLIHVVDLSDPTAPAELSPLLATSLANPSRVVSVGQIAVSPTTREYKRFLYAIDRTEGSILVYDVTDPVGGPRVPLTRPHPEIKPFLPPDRILFGAPVASVAFVQHDWPLLRNINADAGLTPITTAETGLLCNPNPNVNALDNSVGEQGPYTDEGAYFRAHNAAPTIDLMPYRLRGIFAFATLSNGSVITIDVDDWDAPCRRPDPLAAPGTSLTLLSPDGGVSQEIADLLVDRPFSAIAPPQPLAGPGDTDPYHVPVTYRSTYLNSPVSQEWFFPVSAPHRTRSAFFLRNDPTNGYHAPYLLSVPQLFANGAPLATQGPQAVGNPSLVPTDTPYVDPSVFANPLDPNPLNHAPGPQVPQGNPGPHADPSDLLLVQSIPNSVPGVRFAWEDPEVQLDQDWTVTYEGQLPGFFDSGGNPTVLANVLPRNGLVGGGTADAGAADFSAVWLANKNAYFCSKGIEDFALGAQRAAATVQAVADVFPSPDRPVPLTGYGTQVADYVQLTDDILPYTDPYWQLDNTCWDPSDPEESKDQRNTTCINTYGQMLDPTSPSLQRDFPILEAHDDRLLLGRFGYTAGVPTVRTPGSPTWTVVGPDPTNVKALKRMQCCFHNQVHFAVRAGGQWVANGSQRGFLHHIVPTGADARCAPSCEPRDALLNGRAPPVPRVEPPLPTDGGTLASCSGDTPAITRDSVLALRNPMFSFLIWNGQDPAPGCTDHPPARDTQWAFSTRGQFAPVMLNLAASTSGLSPQTMRFIDSLGQLAIIDGSSQGLILIDLNAISLAHVPYF